MSRALPKGFAFSLLIGLFVAACSSSRTASVARLGEAAGCFVNSDCSAPLVCAFQRCHVECTVTRDCHDAQRCVGAEEVAHVCQLDQEAHCKTSADCASGFKCGPDGACRDQCVTAGDCISGQQCVLSVCAEPSELDASGALPQTQPYSNCRLNSDCAVGMKCASNTCVDECRADSDCTGSQTCDGGACHYPGGGRCTTPADCTMTGAECISGQCRCACLANADCASGETCDGCACHAVPPECSAKKPCSTGKICIDGKCACECLADRDCAAGQSCDGCSCQARVVTTVSQALVLNVADIDALAGVTDVQGELKLSGELVTTTGLEKIRSVGSLTIEGTDLVDLPGGTPALVGLSGLVTVRADLTIAETKLSAVAFNPALTVAGAVKISSNPALSTCAILDLQAHLSPTSFTHTGAELVCERHCQGPLCVPATVIAGQ